jgi:SAM-dependent methyltransferase
MAAFSEFYGDRMQRPARYFRCPTCRSGALNSEELQLSCTACGVTFPVVNGVPRFVSSDHYAGTFGMQWNIHRQAQLDSRTGLPLTRHRYELATRWPGNLAGETILEAGSGAGRFTEILAATGAEILSFDLSSAVDANFANNGHNANVLIFQGDIFNIPVCEQSVDKVLCLGVLQHTPDPEAAFHSLARCVRPSGQIVIDCYASRLRSMLSWKYVLRPITTRMDKERLYRVISKLAPPMVPLSIYLRRIFGKAGPRMLPIAQYDDLGLPPELNREWAIMDTFDMLSPAHDHPQSVQTVRRWFQEAGLVDIAVEFGLNGIVARGKRPSG